MRSNGVRITHALVSFVAVAYAVACAQGASDDRPATETSSATPADLTTIEGFCDAIAEASCTDTLVKACGAKGVAACRTSRAARCLKDVPQGTTYVGANASACIAATTDALADANLTSDELDAMDDACGAPIHAGPNLGRASCTTSLDCRSDLGLVCIIPVSPTLQPGTPGKCLVPTHKALGQSCSGEADICAKDAYCEWADETPHVCKPRPTEGQGCHRLFQPCVVGYACPPELIIPIGCSTLPANGAACADRTDCHSNVCDKGKGQEQGTCVDQIPLTGLDSMCEPYLDAPDAAR